MSTSGQCSNGRSHTGTSNIERAWVAGAKKKPFGVASWFEWTLGIGVGPVEGNAPLGGQRKKLPKSLIKLLREMVFFYMEAFAMRLSGLNWPGTPRRPRRWIPRIGLEAVRSPGPLGGPR